VTGRSLYKARFALINAERGSFPNATPKELSDRFQPFGLKHQTDYRAATEDTKDGAPSAWKLWLMEEYGVSLKFEVLRRNNVEAEFKMPDGLVRKRIKAYIAGTSDLLK
jgi:hypothetical protein